MIHQSGLDEYFEFLVSNEDVSRPKPDPEIYTRALARMGVAPADTVIVEDAPHGLEAARRSGATCAASRGSTTWTISACARRSIARNGSDQPQTGVAA